MQVSANPISLYKHIQKAHVKGQENLITTETPFPKPYIFLLQTSLYVKGAQISLFIWPPILKSNEQMHLSFCLHTHRHPRSFMWSPSTVTEGPPCLSTTCQHLYRICTYSSCIPILFELLKIIYPEKTYFLRKWHCFPLPTLYKISKINFMPNQEEKHLVTFCI